MNNNNNSIKTGLATSLMSSFFIVFIIIPMIARGSALTFPEALELAYRQAPDLHRSQAEIDKARGRVVEAKGKSWPKLVAEMSGVRSNNPLNVFGFKLSQGNASFADFGAQQFTGPASLYTQPSALNHPGYYNNFNAAFKLSFPIYSGGEIIAQQQAAQALLDAACLGDKSAKEQYGYQLLQVFEGVLLSQRIERIAKAQVAQAQKYRKRTEQLAKQSITLNTDVDMAIAFQQASELNLADSRTQTKNQLDLFRALLGQPGSTHTPAKSVTIQALPMPEQQLSMLGISQNPALSSARSQIHAQRQAVVAARSAYLPRVNLELRQDWNGYHLGEGFPSSQLALGMHWTLFSGNERGGALQQTRSSLAQAQFDLDKMKNELMTQIHQEKRNEQQASYAARVNSQLVSKQQNIVHSLYERYGRGLVPLGYLIDNQTKLTQARVQKLHAMYQQKIARAHLHLLIGDMPLNHHAKQGEKH